VDGVPTPYYYNQNPQTKRWEIAKAMPRGVDDRLVRDFPDFGSARDWIAEIFREGRMAELEPDWRPPSREQWEERCLNTPTKQLPQLRGLAHEALEACGYHPLWNEHIGTLERIMKERGIAVTPSERLQESFKGSETKGQ
jgi:hypothetical protein